jgi:hypothetical protein
MKGSTILPRRFEDVLDSKVCYDEGACAQMQMFRDRIGIFGDELTILIAPLQTN